MSGIIAVSDNKAKHVLPGFFLSFFSSRKQLRFALDPSHNNIPANLLIYRLHLLFQKTAIAYLISLFLEKPSRSKKQSIYSKAYCGTGLFSPEDDDAPPTLIKVIKN